LNTVKSEIVKEFAPTGKLRAAINLGNTVLAQKDPGGGEPNGIAVMLTKKLGNCPFLARCR
jgi:polar amino acid transport system substrate-binding protein